MDSWSEWFRGIFLLKPVSKLYSVISVSLADVALALLIIFFICGAKSALW